MVPLSLLNTTREHLIAAVETLIDAQCVDGGWSWSRGIKKGTLYFSWCAVEGLADFYDYIVGESEEQIRVPPDEAMLTMIAERNPGLLKKIEEARGKVSEFLSSNYLAKALGKGLDIDDFSEDRRIEFSGQGASVAIVYFELYLLESLILLNYDAPGRAFSKENRDKLVQLYQRILRQLVRLRGTPKDDPFWTRAESGTLKFNILSSKAYHGKQDGFPVQDPGLWPQFVRTMVLYRFYTDQSADLDADIVGEDASALRYLLDDQRAAGSEPGDGLWDRFAHNLAITSRAIEGLIDVYDYYNRVGAKNAAHQAPATADLAAQLADAIFPHISAKLLVITGTQPTAPTQARSEVEGLRGQIRESVGDFLRDQLFEATSPLTEWSGITRTQVLEQAFTKTGLKELKANDEARELAERLVWLNFCSTVRLFDLILKEALLDHVNRDQADAFRKVDTDGSKDRQALANRIRLAFKAIADNEVDTSVERPESPPNYKDIVQRLLTVASSKQKGK